MRTVLSIKLIEKVPRYFYAICRGKFLKKSGIFWVFSALCRNSLGREIFPAQNNDFGQVPRLDFAFPGHCDRFPVAVRSRSRKAGLASVVHVPKWTASAACTLMVCSRFGGNAPAPKSTLAKDVL
tara:strand:+ start:4931 stop:5305 length:375 start_codon:yes stop_codon:yes gene_type:complete